MTISGTWGIVKIKQTNNIKTEREVIAMSGKLNHNNFIMDTQNKQAQSPFYVRIS